MQEAVTVNIWKKAESQKTSTSSNPTSRNSLDLTKQEAEILMKVKETTTPYDAFIDNYEPKMSADNNNHNLHPTQRWLKAA